MWHSLHALRYILPLSGDKNMELKRKLGLSTAVLIIIADVIGTGIFITTGQILEMTGSALSVLILFGVGGLIALAGALCYAELSTMWPDDGGEYIYLKKIYGLLPSFLTGWISLLVGFSLASAMSAITAVNYINKLSADTPLISDWYAKLCAASIILVFASAHLIGVQKGSFVQNILTVLKLLIILLFITIGFYFINFDESRRLIMSYEPKGQKSIIEYGAALIIVMYAYSGWNGTAYIAGEIREPETNLPRALVWATALITFIYLAINVVFLLSSPGQEIITDGRYTIGSLAAKKLFGDTISPFFNLSTVLILLSSVSVQMMVGPRVSYAMAQDKVIFRSLGRVSKKYYTPYAAIAIQAAIAMLYAFIGFDAIHKMLIYMGFALSIFPFLAILGMVYWRYEHPEIKRPFKVPLFPMVPVIYLVLSFGIMLTTLMTNTIPSLVALAVVGVGTGIFFYGSDF
jgi:APA family basic amino acid/polyamine antiporter